MHVNPCCWCFVSCSQLQLRQAKLDLIQHRAPSATHHHWYKNSTSEYIPQPKATVQSRYKIFIAAKTAKAPRFSETVLVPKVRWNWICFVRHALQGSYSVACQQCTYYGQTTCSRHIILVIHPLVVFRQWIVHFMCFKYHLVTVFTLHIDTISWLLLQWNNAVRILLDLNR